MLAGGIPGVLDYSSHVGVHDSYVLAWSVDEQPLYIHPVLQISKTSAKNPNLNPKSVSFKPSMAGRGASAQLSR